MGILFEVYKEIGYGFRERYYQQAIEEELKEKNIPFKREVYVPLEYRGKKIGKYFIDFKIDNKIALELKVADRFYKSHINQLLSYLNASDVKLGILAIVTPEGVQFKRFVL